MEQENDVLLNRGSADSKTDQGCKWERWIPFYCGFWTYHFGTDLLIASWLFVIASAIWVIIEVAVIVKEPNVHRFFVSFNHECTLACTILFLLGSIYFVYLSYPEELHKMAEILAHEDASKLPFIQKYFTGSDFLIGSWFFAIATFPFVIYGVYATIAEPTSIIGWGYLFVSGVMFCILGIWVYASFPESMQANNGHGSTVVYDRWLSKSCCCCSDLMEKHCKTDLLVGMWAFLIITAALLPEVIYVCIKYPDEVNSWLDLVMTVLFTIGCALMTYSSYEGNQETSVVWTFFGCHPSAKIKDDL